MAERCRQLHTKKIIWIYGVILTFAGGMQSYFSLPPKITKLLSGISFGADTVCTLEAGQGACIQRSSLTAGGM